MKACLPQVTVQSFRPHVLHGLDRCWAETNCYIDLWIEILHALGLPPEAALGFTAAQDFEGDQFTFTKFPLEDLETLYGLKATELAIYEPVERHVLRQMARRRMCLVEVDPYFLPDTDGTSYRREHGKTTIAPNRLDPQRKRLEYFHNGAYAVAEGEDFDGIFPAWGEERPGMWPYVEFTTLEPIRRAPLALKAIAGEVFAWHWGRRPQANPIRAFQAAAPEQIERLAGSEQAFHAYAFHNLRLLGANFELLGSGLAWLNPEDSRAGLCRKIAETAKTAQFQLARTVARRKLGSFAPTLEPAAEAWEELFTAAQARAA
ncbi:MAG: DUF1839 family protein [Phenylobacterium sp.]|nr:MAG: DUF1839 family protein [Phenylobacterium sp.]